MLNQQSSWLQMWESLAAINKVTRLLSTRVKSIKIEHLTWYLQCFVCIIIQGPEVQKDAKLVFHPEQRGGLVLLVMSVDELVYVFPQLCVCVQEQEERAVA